MPWQRARRRKSLLAHFVMNTETKREIPYVCRSSNIAIASHCPSNSLASPCICLVQHGVPWHKNFQIQLTKSSPLSNFQKVFLRDRLSALWNLQVKNLSIFWCKINIWSFQSVVENVIFLPTVKSCYDFGSLEVVVAPAN